MNILVLLKHGQLDQSIINFVTSLFSQADAQLHLLNIISTPGDIPTQKNGQVLDFCTEFDLSGYKLKSDTHINYLNEFNNERIVERHALIGNRRDIIHNYIEQKEIDLVVGGAHKTSALEDIFVTTFAADVLEHTQQPFLTIKCNRDNFQPQGIALIHDFIQIEQENLSVIKRIAEMHQSKIILTKIRTHQDKRSKEEIEKAMLAYAEQNNLDPAIQIIESIDKEKGVSNIQAEHPTDLIAIGRAHKMTIGQFLGHSELSSIVNHIYAPILIY